MIMKRALLKICLILLGGVSSSLFALNMPIKNSLPDGDKLIYGRLVEAYRQQKVNDVVAQKVLLEKNYPSSIHMDNALYMAGVLQIQRNRIPEGLRDLSKLEKNYPQSLKRPSALYAKAMAYQKLELPKQQRSVLDSIVKKYAGSVESQKAWVDLRLMNERGQRKVKR